MTVKIDIISGFLGAGKTTMIKKLLDANVLGDSIAMIENEFGDISIDSNRLEESGVEIKSISSGCICCTLSGDFQIAIKELIKEHSPNRIIIEPTGVGRLSDIISTVNMTKKFEDIDIDLAMTIVDALEFEDFIEVFGDFFKDQIQYANVIALSKTQLTDESKVNNVINSIRDINPNANIIATSWDDLEAKDILDAAKSNKENKDICVHDGYDCDHEHDHEEDSANTFDYCSIETMKTYSEEELTSILNSLNDPMYGKVLRAKGSLLRTDKKWLDFDFTPNNFDTKEERVKTIGQVTIIGKNLNKDSIRNLFD
ncbi:GTP-binding protein [Schnuerera sp. xch1]|uniref:CobW family GTP-binding protein n=1 Tax=Schnuerera sp. xch1 TaxID=2874283 RepID=UPI001CBABDBC|nr:GTP-binding protein [Schnuerera sp. xch1]MBZ2174711.1 GTP-binding protein [Schnuerera sp. xch1]